MTINPFQNTLISALSTALTEGGYPDSELYFDQLTPLAILSQQAEETGQTVDEVAEETNKEMENPDTTEDSGEGIVDTNLAAEEREFFHMSLPKFSQEFETYKS
jgi:hypothetical protein